MGGLVIRTVRAGKARAQSTLALERKLSLSSEAASWGHTGTKANNVETEVGSHLGENPKTLHARKHLKTWWWGHTALKTHHKADNPVESESVQGLYHQGRTPQAMSDLQTAQLL